MPQTLTFSHAFPPKEGDKDGKKWQRYDFKTADGERYVTFNAGLANKISVNTPVTLEVEGNKIVSLIASVPAENQQERNQSQNGSRGHSGPENRSQGHSEKPDWDAIARGKVKSLLWAALVPAMYQSITPKTDQTPEAAQQLVEYAMGEIFPEDLPF